MNDLINRYPILIDCMESISEAIRLIKNAYESNNTLYLAGNGGSASDCDHISGELIKSFKLKRKLNLSDKSNLEADLAENLQGGLPAVPLPNFSGLISAYSNDCNSDYTYAQLLWALGKEGDVLFAISTSGKSSNVIKSMKVAKAKKITTIGLTGQSGGIMSTHADCLINVPSNETYIIQEYHLPIYHYICIELEKYFFE